MSVVVTHKQLKALQAGSPMPPGPRRGCGGRTPGRQEGMNRLEAAYRDRLESRRLAGTVAWWAWQPIKIRLADNTFYEVDFMLMTNDGLIEVHEVKGHWEDDARVKIKVAAQVLPFRFVAVTKEKGAHRNGGKWEYEVIAE